jgi:hypothetical protein
VRLLEGLVSWWMGCEFVLIQIIRTIDLYVTDDTTRA